MNNPILFPSAKNDIREAANWYDQQHPLLQFIILQLN